MKEYMNITTVPRISETKKLTLLSDFKSGQKFDGKIVDLSEDRTSVTIKLRDGSKFTAKLDGELKGDLTAFISFEVDGVENGVLKLKLSNGKEQSFGKVESLKDSIELIINKLGLSAEKKEILEKMLEFKIPLTKENIENINTLLDFRDKANINSNFIKHFIESYISSKGIIEASSDNVFIKEHLNTFFSELKGMSNSEIMSFVEGEIDFSTNNLKSFNNIFRVENGFFKGLVETSEKMQTEILGEKSEVFNTLIKDLKSFGLEIDKFTFEDFNKLENIVNEKNLKFDINNLESIKLDFPDKIDNIKFNIAKLDNFQDIIDELKRGDRGILKNEVAKNSIEKVINGFKDVLLSNNLDGLDDKVSKMMDKLVRNFDSLEDKHMTIVRNVLSSIENEIDNTKEVLRQTKVADIKGVNDVRIFKEIDGILKDFTEVKVSLSEKQDLMKDVIKGITEKISNNEVATSMINGILKDKINDFKLFNDFSNEYYYLDVPLKLEEEYPCKLIIKDQRKDGKVLDSKNMKLVINLKTIRLGEVDALIDISQENIRVNLMVLKENMKILEKNNDKLHKALELLGFMPYIFVSEKKEMEAKSLSEYRKFFNDTSILSIDRKV